MKPKPPMQMTPEIAKKIESECQAARHKVLQGIKHLYEAAWLAGQTGNYELDKMITAIQTTIQSAAGTLIMLPRLRDDKKSK